MESRFSHVGEGDPDHMSSFHFVPSDTSVVNFVDCICQARDVDNAKIRELLTNVVAGNITECHAARTLEPMLPPFIPADLVVADAIKNGTRRSKNAVHPASLFADDMFRWSIEYRSTNLRMKRARKAGGTRERADVANEGRRIEHALRIAHATGADRDASSSADVNRAYWRYSMCTDGAIRSMSVRDKRTIFAKLRTMIGADEVWDSNLFIPAFGVTAMDLSMTFALAKCKGVPCSVGNAVRQAVDMYMPGTYVEPPKEPEPKKRARKKRQPKC